MVVLTSHIRHSYLSPSIPPSLPISFSKHNRLYRLNFDGFVAIHIPPRPRVAAAVAELQQSHVAVVMITGDARATAARIGAQLGIFDESKHTALSGDQLDGMTTAELDQVVLNDEVRIMYHTSPKHKPAVVRAFQNGGQITVTTGDGINNALALKLANIGVAMGVIGSDVSKEAADVVLVNDDFQTIKSATEEGKVIYSNILKFLHFQLSTSVAALGIVIFCSVIGLPNPLNAMQILWINIIMDGPPAQSLGVKPVDLHVMLEPPRRPTNPIITKTLILHVLQSAAITTAGTIFVFLKECVTRGRCGWVGVAGKKSARMSAEDEREDRALCAGKLACQSTPSTLYKLLTLPHLPSPSIFHFPCPNPPHVPQVRLVNGEGTSQSSHHHNDLHDLCHV